MNWYQYFQTSNLLETSLQGVLEKSSSKNFVELLRTHLQWSPFCQVESYKPFWNSTLSRVFSWESFRTDFSRETKLLKSWMLPKSILINFVIKLFLRIWIFFKLHYLISEKRNQNSAKYSNIFFNKKLHLRCLAGFWICLW